MDKITPSKMAKRIAKTLKEQNPNYDYLRETFRFIRKELNIKVTTQSKALPYVPTEEEIKQFYKTVWESKEVKHMIIIKTLLLTGARVSELINIRLDDVNLTSNLIKINKGKGGKDRVVPFSNSFKETLALHIRNSYKENRIYLFESGFRRKYSDRGIRKMLMKYTKKSGIEKSISPHKLRHFLFTWLKKQGIDDALIQPYSGHETRKSLEIYSKLTIIDAQISYDKVINDFPV